VPGLPILHHDHRLPRPAPPPTRRTARLIDDAQRSGLARIAERNRRTLGKLDAIIDALEATRPGQIVAGGTVENLDAAG
jgi:hypothetical protein